MANTARATRSRFWPRLIRIIGVIVPQRLRADWKQEWEAELRNREVLLADWDKLDRKTKFDLCRRSLGAFWDGLALPPQRLEDEMFQDVRFRFRQAIRKPGLIIAVGFCLAFGIGANILVFGLINAVVLRPAPGVAAPEELAVIMNRTGEDGYDLTSYPDYLDYRNLNQSFTDLLVYRAIHVSLSIDGSTERIQGAVESAAPAPVMPLGGGSPSQAVFIEGQQQPSADRPLMTDHNIVTPGWFQTMGIPLIAGRDFSNHDAADAAGVVIINEAMAHRYGPDRQPIGLRFEFGETQRRTVEIIGIARNSKHRTLDEEPRPLMYLPLLQQYDLFGTLFSRRCDPNTARLSLWRKCDRSADVYCSHSCFGIGCAAFLLSACAAGDKVDPMTTIRQE